MEFETRYANSTFIGKYCLFKRDVSSSIFFRVFHQECLLTTLIIDSYDHLVAF